MSASRRLDHTLRSKVIIVEHHECLLEGPIRGNLITKHRKWLLEGMVHSDMVSKH
jgi:hypothetical protein